MKILEAARLRRAKMAGILLLAAVPMLAASTSAQAAVAAPQALKATSVSYNVSWEFKSAPLHKCVIFSATGKVNYSVGVPSGERHWEWNNITVVAPRLTAVVHTFTGGSCIGPATIQSINMAQHWVGGFSCGLNPSISVSVPWGISVSGWPGCGNRKQASRSQSFPSTNGSYVQNNTGTPIHFGGIAEAQQKDFPCLGVDTTSSMRIANMSDSFAGGSKKVCLSKA